ncbi:hypothetical protein BT69DRAFT_1316708, partial [Atractiella rhizophila]
MEVTVGARGRTGKVNRDKEGSCMRCVDMKIPCRKRQATSLACDACRKSSQVCERTYYAGLSHRRKGLGVDLKGLRDDDYKSSTDLLKDIRAQLPKKKALKFSQLWKDKDSVEEIILAVLNLRASTLQHRLVMEERTRRFADSLLSLASLENGTDLLLNYRLQSATNRTISYEEIKQNRRANPSLNADFVDVLLFYTFCIGSMLSTHSELVGKFASLRMPTLQDFYSPQTQRAHFRLMGRLKHGHGRMFLQRAFDLAFMSTSTFREPSLANLSIILRLLFAQWSGYSSSSFPLLPSTPELLALARDHYRFLWTHGDEGVRTKLVEKGDILSFLIVIDNWISSFNGSVPILSEEDYKEYARIPYKLFTRPRTFIEMEVDKASNVQLREFWACTESIQRRLCFCRETIRLRDEVKLKNMLEEVYEVLLYLRSWWDKKYEVVFVVKTASDYQLYRDRRGEQKGGSARAYELHSALAKLFACSCRWLGALHEASTVFSSDYDIEKLGKAAGGFQDMTIRHIIMYVCALIGVKRTAGHNTPSWPNRERDPLAALNDLPGGFRNVLHFAKKHPDMWPLVTTVVEHMKFLSWRHYILSDELDAFEEEASITEERVSELLLEEEDSQWNMMRSRSPSLEDFDQTLRCFVTDANDPTSRLASPPTQEIGTSTGAPIPVLSPVHDSPKWTD